MGVETLMMAAAAASAASSMIGGVNAYQMAGYNAKVMRSQADQARQDAGVEAQLALEKGARDTGAGIVAAAKSGGGFDGSAMSVLQDLGRQSMYEARRISTEGVGQSDGLYAQARATKQQGAVQLFTSTLDAGATLLSAGMAQKQRADQKAILRRQSTSSARIDGGSSWASAGGWGAAPGSMNRIGPSY